MKKLRMCNASSGRLLRGTMAGLLAVAMLAGCGEADEDRRYDAGSAAGGETTASADTAQTASGASVAARSSEASKTPENSGSTPLSTSKQDRSLSLPPEKQQRPEPQAGMLTAGEWDDLGAWSRWMKLVQDSPYPAAWGFAPTKRLAVQVMAQGEPARDAEVILHCGGKREWTARTDADGKATLFADLLEAEDGQEGPIRNEPAAPTEGKGSIEDRPAAPQGCSVQIDAGHGLIVRDAETKDWAGRVMKLETEREAPQPDAVLDLLLMIDTTGSMADELDYLSTELTNVVSRVKKNIGQDLTVRISPNFYRDRKDEYVVRSFPFLEDAVKAQAHIARQEADGGQDYPEAVAEALTDAVLEHDWSRSAKARLMLLVLDAPPHQGEQERESIQLAAAEAAKQGIRIVPIAASGTDLETELLMRTLAVATGGSYVFLTDDSGIGNGHKKPEGVEPQILPLNDLLVDLISRYAGGEA
ncbi:VWA domain-containing protein [Paenibacillus albicereus]|uniref:VWA domain-containing protein n=1 Tax=Paenibacillus albicereus TaxID=2726185 RepID=A0A6H2GVA8_9BACL|nr:VWA domain-containing protein [Paenibacillus albicereus]QJC51322.1 VWA domain-containing protein [Paenibacillus albicereus]